jgi:hypothetical protein
MGADCLSNKFRTLFAVFTAIFAVGTCIAVPLVTYLILHEIDPATSFYYDNAKLVPFVNAFLIALTVLLVIPAFIKRAHAPTETAPQKQPVLAVLSLLFAVMLLAYSASGLYHALFSKADVGSFLTGATGILGSIFFFLFGANRLYAKQIDLRLAGLLPVLFGVVNLIVTFMNLTQIANISQYLYCVLQMVFAILFLYYNARLAGGVSNGHELNGVFAFGLPCAFYGLLAALPPVIAHLQNNKRGSLPTLQDGMFLALSLYILALLITLLLKKPAPAVAEMIEQPEEQPTQPQVQASSEDKPGTEI